MSSDIFMTPILSNPSRGDVGIELEYEFKSISRGLRNFTNANPYWNIVDEGSLRNGSEFVLRKPTYLRDLPEAFEVLYSQIDLSQVVSSIRTSTHIHVNIKSMTPKDVFCFLPLYWCIERSLVRLHGTAREGNLFCLRSTDAEEIIHMVIREMQNYRTFRSFERVKYSALNLYPIYRQGSVEFRFLKMMTDPTEIISWCCNLTTLVHAARQYSSPTHVLQELEKNPEALYRTIFTKEFMDLFKGVDFDNELNAVHSLLRYYCQSYATPKKKPMLRYAFTSEELRPGSEYMEFTGDDL